MDADAATNRTRFPVRQRDSCLPQGPATRVTREYRDTMVENVPLHRDIEAAWAAQGGS